MRFANQSTLIASLALTILCGCKHHNAINFVTNTEFGVKVGVNAEKIPEVKIGYSRQEAARVPVYLMDGAIANRTSGEVNSLLNQASKSLETAAGSATAANQKIHVETAKGLIQSALQADTATKKGQSKSPILPQINDAVAKLPADGATLADAGQIAILRGMIAAERDRPVFHAEFQEAGKFIGNKNGKDANDAYSVIGTFKGNAGGGAGNQTNASMGIAQYFATGVAAQLLAEGGGAALVSTADNAHPPINQARVEQVKKNAQAAVSDARKIAADVFKAGPAGAAADATLRTSRLTTFFTEANLDEGDTPASEAAYYASLSKDELETKLANYYEEDLKKMAAKIPVP